MNPGICGYQNQRPSGSHSFETVKAPPMSGAIDYRFNPGSVSPGSRRVYRRYSQMNRAVYGLPFLLLGLCFAMHAQLPIPSRLSFPAILSAGPNPNPMGGAGAGQVEYSASRGGAFSLASADLAVSTLGIGAEAGTNLGTRLDLRVFANYTNLTHRYTQSGFQVALNVALANTGAKVDFYPFQRVPLRISPGFLLWNRNRVQGSTHAQRGATFTINNVDYASSDPDPVSGVGRLLLGGRGFMLTAGLGHFVSRSHKRFTFPFEAGVAFINTPAAQFQFFGSVCTETEVPTCAPVSQFPGFSANLAAQLATWNRRVAPFHTYPILQGGVAYSFSLRRRGFQ